MRIGLVIYGSLDTGSGGYLYDRKLVETLERCGDTVEVIGIPRRAYSRNLLDNFSAGLAHRIKSLDLDILLQDELNHPSLWLANRFSFRNRPYPVIAIVHHLRSNEQHAEVLRRLYAQIERAYLRTLDGFIFNSQSTRREVVKLAGRAARGLVAYPGAGLEPDPLDADQIAARARQPGPLRVLFVGNLIARKGLHHLLQAAASLPEGLIQLTVVGNQAVDTAYFRKVRQQASQSSLTGRVQFLGRVADERLRDLFRSHQVLAVPSSYEGFGIVYLEGFSYGLPAIAALEGGAGEVVAHGVSGYLVRAGDVGALAGNLADLAGDRDKLARMSLKARQRFDNHPGWDASMMKAREYLLSCIHGTQPAS